MTSRPSHAAPQPQPQQPAAQRAATKGQGQGGIEQRLQDICKCATQPKKEVTEEIRELTQEPTLGLAIVTCMDPRLHVSEEFCLKTGEAHIIRNGGGRMADALRSLAVSQQYGKTNKVWIIHHTDCALSKFTDADIRAKLEEKAGVDVDHVAFLPFVGEKDPAKTVLEDVKQYRNSKLVRQDVELKAWVFNVATQTMHEVPVPPLQEQQTVTAQGAEQQFAKMAVKEKGGEKTREEKLTEERKMPAPKKV
jgi:carbonic anhydrase